jgi:hypothetical protein
MEKMTVSAAKVNVGATQKVKKKVNAAKANVAANNRLI